MFFLESNGMTWDSSQLYGVPLALLGALFLSLGTHYQSKGVVKVEKISGKSGEKGLHISHLRALLNRPSWMVGALFLILAIVFQLISMVFSPIIVVQPLGVIAIVITALINSKVNNIKISKKVKLAIFLCVTGIAIFVSVAAFTAVENPVSDKKIFIVLFTMFIVFVFIALSFFIFKSSLNATYYIIFAGIIYGFVATIAKISISKFQYGSFDLLLFLCLFFILLGTVIGAYFVQTAHSSGPPELVIAGLTVIDPIVAVLIGIIVLEEASNSGLYGILVYIFSGIVAVLGVFILAKYQPKIK